MVTIKEQALQYLAKGLSIIPVAKNKTPLIKWEEFQKRKPTVDEVEQWFQKWPDTNIAIVTGQVSGLAVVDFDTPEALVIGKAKGLPNTPMVQTARGYHAYFKYQEGVRNFQKRADLPGIDLRGEGGYVVAPPSVHENGSVYTGFSGDVSLSDLPEWVLAKNESEKTPLKELYSGVSKGERNMSLARLVGSWAHDGLTLDECLAMASAVNQKFNPPMSEKEVRECTQSIFDLHQREKVKSVGAVDTKGGFGTLIPEVKFDLNVFPAPLVGLIRKIAESFSINVEPVAVMMLSILSAAIGNSIRISPKESWKEPPFIWAMIMGESGEGKTPFSSTLLSIVYELQGRARNSLSLGIGTSFDKEINLELQPKYLVSDTTIEALSVTMAQCPRGVISSTDELAGFIKLHDRYAQGNDRQKYLELWSCQPWTVDRISRPSIYIKDTGLSVCGGIQLSIVPLIFGRISIDDGLLPRFLFTFVRVNLDYSSVSVDKSDMKVWNDLVLSCYRIPLSKNSQGEVVHDVLRLSDDAVPAFNQFMLKYKKIAHYSSDNAFKVFIPKFTNYVLRIAGVLHVISRKDETEKIISLQTINDSIRLVEYFSSEAVKVLNLYNQAKEAKKTSLNEIQIRLIKVLRTVAPEAKKGRILLSRILQEFNDYCPESIKLDPQGMAYLLMGLGLGTKLSGGYSVLIWEDEKIKTLLGRLNRL